MRFVLLATLTGAAFAKSYLGQLPNALQARQGGDAFIPGTAGFVSNCPTPCGRNCLQISRGDTCCTEGYGCPGGSFCLTKGYCCPDGDDPATCAKENGITLPDGFKAGNTVTPGTASSIAVATTPSPVPSPSPVSISTPPEAATPSPAPPLYASPSNSTVPAATAHATSSGPASPSTSVVPFTGGANSMRFAAEGGITAVLFAAGALGLFI